MKGPPSEELLVPASSIRKTHDSTSARWGALAFAMTFPGVMAWIYFVQLAQPEKSSSSLAFPIYLLSKVLQFAFPLLWLWWFDQDRLHLPARSFRGLAVGLGFSLLAGVLMFSVYYGRLRGSQLLAATPANVAAKVSLFHADTPARYLVLCLFVAGVHSLMEEYYWRWFVFSELKRLMAVRPAIVVSSLAFMVHHVVILGVYFPHAFYSAALPFSFCVAFGGAVWAWIYHQTGSIYTVWLSHLLVDAAILVIGYDMVFVLPLAG